MIDWDDIRVFLAVADAGSLRVAAAELKVSQPTVARRLAALEEAAGSGPLFERTAHGHFVSARGASLLPAARSLAEAAMAFERQVSGLTETISGAVRVGAYGWVSHFIASRAQRFRDELPGIRLELAGMRANDAGLARRDADLGIFEGSLASELPSRGSLVTRSLGQFAFGVYGAPTLLQATNAAHDPLARFTACPWVAHDEVAVSAGAGNALRTSHRWLENRIEGRMAHVRCADVSSLLAAARTGVGLAVLPRFVGDKDPNLVRVLNELDGEAPVELWLGVHRDLRRSKCVRAVMDLLIDIFDAARPELAGAD